MRDFTPYHLAWLAAHPERTPEWLRERLADRFDVHHVDGDRSNNDPSNLVLIEGGDHLMLHNGHRKMLRMSGSERQKARTPRLGRKKHESLADRFGVTPEQMAEWQNAPRYTAWMK